ncbi:hypothetical protein IMSAGC013_02185 [Lachnospiraceae bacterium]|nr:hypothetical protein IMSAGC013_02185 [Lachnospiraceae bacterium]
MSKSATVGEAEYVTAHEVINTNMIPINTGRKRSGGWTANQNPFLLQNSLL